MSIDIKQKEAKEIVNIISGGNSTTIGSYPFFIDINGNIYKYSK